MLIYLANGIRDYARGPVEPSTRRAWEFQAVVRGSIGLIHEAGPDLLQNSRLWLLPPTYRHGWTGEKNKPAQVIVFHFQFVPELISSLARSASFLDLPLTRKQCLRLIELADQAAPYWQHPSIGATICFEHILLELSMLILSRHKVAMIGSPLELSQQRVNTAIAWFTDRIAENPGLEQVAKAVGTSPSNLRRVFHEVLQASPKQVFDRLRFQRAMQLMSDSRTKLENVGEACGFGSASSFSRAFKMKFGCSPDAWRTSS